MEIFDSRYFKINKLLLESSGLWPYQSARKKFFIRVCVTLVIFGIILPQLISVYIYLGVDMDLMVEHLAIVLYVFIIYLKFLTSIITENKLKTVYDNVAANWTKIKDENELDILIQYSEGGRTLTIGYIMYMITALILFVTLPATPAILNIVMPLNESRQRIFILGGSFLIDNQKHYGKVYTFDCLACCVTVWLICAVDCMYAGCIEHCLGLFAIIKFRLQTCTEIIPKDHSAAVVRVRKDENYGLIVRTIQLHKDIINFTNILEASYSLSFLILVGINLLFLSFESILVIIKLDQVMECIRFTMILLGIIVHLFFVSWPGQKLIDYSTGLYLDAYYNEWYLCSVRAQKLLAFMTLRCKRPCQLTAGGLYVMNFPNFAYIVKTSMSYMTVFASFR